VTSSRISAGTPAYRRLALALLIAGLSTFALLYSVQSLLPVFAREFHVSAAESSLVVSLATGAMALMLLVASVVSDRVGRRAMMVTSLFAGSILTIVSAVLPSWHALLFTRFLTGIALSGIPAIAMTYLAEEVDAKTIGGTMGLYIAGAALGGMIGRIGSSVIADWLGWRVALGSVGVICLIGAFVFRWAAPVSRSFVPRRHDLASFLDSIHVLRRDAGLPWLYCEGFLLMGAFITIYNYVSFRLLAPPYSLSQSAVGAIFLFYIVGSFVSTWYGKLAGRLGRRRVFWIPILVFLLGVGMTAASPLILIVAGIGVATAGYFGAHSVASSWVGRRGHAAPAQAAAFYSFFMYVGSSVLGSAGGMAWSHAKWPGVAIFIMVLLALALAVAVRLISVKPLPQNVVTGPPEAV
jgi:MFS transporter, YNFM family, putative membrane transport protein